ncbi:MAG: prepilin-type N-terminal cleavage/methylation domain-containing protein [Thermoanaerobaculia bacterium]
MSTPRWKTQAGLTLVEMLIAVALLGIVLLGIAPLFIVSVRSNYSANEYTSIHNLGRDRLEQLMNLPVTNAQLSAATATFPNDLPTTLPDPLTGVPPSGVANPFTRIYTVNHFTSTPPAVAGGPYTLNPVLAGQPYDFKEIVVTVTSRSGGTNLGIGARTAQVSGFLRNPDPANNVL